MQLNCASAGDKRCTIRKQCKLQSGDGCVCSKMHPFASYLLALCAAVYLLHAMYVFVHHAAASFSVVLAELIVCCQIAAVLLLMGMVNFKLFDGKQLAFGWLSVKLASTKTVCCGLSMLQNPSVRCWLLSSWDRHDFNGLLHGAHMTHIWRSAFRFLSTLTCLPATYCIGM